MRKQRFTEEQIIGALKRTEGGLKVHEVCRLLGVSRHTFYVWRNKFDGMDVSEAKRLRKLADENRRLKHLVADLTLDKQALTVALGQEWRP